MASSTVLHSLVFSVPHAVNCVLGLHGLPGLHSKVEDGACAPSLLNSIICLTGGGSGGTSNTDELLIPLVVSTPFVSSPVWYDPWRVPHVLADSSFNCWCDMSLFGWTGIPLLLSLEISIFCYPAAWLSVSK